MFTKKLIATTALMAISAYAQNRPGVDRPIRVGTFMGTGTARYWHTNIQTAQTALGNILANPTTAGLGANLVVPTRGFTFTKFGVTCENCSPTAAQTTAFINALDTLDVAYIGCFVELGNILSNTAQRDRLRNFMVTKAYIGVHAVNDSYGTWASLDSVNATRFQNHPSGDRAGMVRRDSVAQTNLDWQYLNQGLFANGTDTTFTEEWFSYTTSGSAIRAGNNLGSQLITTKMSEETYVGGMGGAAQMGDHPMSWGRKMAAGGRVFYTGVGHRVQNYQGGANPRYLRRQIYNAILWVAKYDSLSVVSIDLKYAKAPETASAYSKFSVSGSDVAVTMLIGGKHAVELTDLGGRRVDFREGSGEVGKAYSLNKPKSGMYALSVVTRDGRSSRLITVP